MFKPGKTYQPARQGLAKADILDFIELPDLDSRTWQLWEVFMQVIQVDSGVTNATQGDLSGLPQNTTATGINSMLETSSVLHLEILDELRDGLEKHLSYCAEVAYFRQDTDETYEYLEGDGADAVIALDPANSQTAARLVAPLGQWRRQDPGRQALMRAELRRILALPGLSRGTFEQASRALGETG